MSHLSASGEGYAYAAGRPAFPRQWGMVELPRVLLSGESEQFLSILLIRATFASLYALYTGAALYLLSVIVVVVITTICTQIMYKEGYAGIL